MILPTYDQQGQNQALTSENWINTIIGGYKSITQIEIDKARAKADAASKTVTTKPGVTADPTPAPFAGGMIAGIDSRIIYGAAALIALTVIFKLVR
jgi:hypothetical protein